MKSSIQLSTKEKLKHLIYWSVIAVFLGFADPLPGNLLFQLSGTLSIMLIYIFIYYSIYLYILPKFFGTNQVKLFLSILTVFIFYISFNYTFFYHILTFFDYNNPFEKLPNYYLTLNLFLLFAIISVVAFGAFQNKLSILKIQIQNEKEKALLIKELGFFRNQFNSHITFNFLNYCYNYVQGSSKEAAAAIEQFSGMLRYTINSKPDERVLLEKEVEYIIQFINLKKQLSKGICVEFHSEGSLANTFIYPRMLITFVENAFKHGKTHEETNPILIHLKVDAQHLTFEVKNKKNNSKIVISTGIGQNNAKNQLELFYKNNHTLKIEEDEDNYVCKLVLKK